MTLIYIIIGLFILGIVYWTIRITKATILNLDYIYITKLFILALSIGGVINGLDYLITN